MSCPVITGRDHAGEPTLCGEPLRQWTVCAVHANQLRQDLAELPGLHRDLERVLARYRGGLVAGGGGGEALPYNLAASEVAGTIRAVLVAWIRDLDDNPEHHPADTVTAMALWLGARHHRLAGHPAAEEVVREIHDVHQAAKRAYFGPTLPESLGPCTTCREPLYTAQGRAFTTCRVCGTGYDVADRKSALRAELRDQLLTAAEIADMARYFGDVADREKTRNLVKLWGSRRVIEARGHDESGSPRYRFGEVLDRLAEVQARKAG